MQYSFSPSSLLSKLSDLGMYLIAAVSAVMLRQAIALLPTISNKRSPFW
ncbi:hypothetical protein LC609_21265 [Nostoc sp. XA013]|nr:hypothetical protein [Nostoc sp. XA013]